MKKLFLMIFFAAFILSGCQKQSDEKTEPIEDENVTAQKEEKPKAPDFMLQDTEGKNVSLADYKGKIVLLDFWATWCAPCRKGIPDLVALQTEYKDDLVVIGISLDQQTKKDVVPFMKEFNINYPVVYGDGNIVANYGNIRSIPTSFVIDKEGNIVDMHVGLVSKSVYEKEIKKLL